MFTIFQFVLLFHTFVFVSMPEITGNYSQLNPKSCGISRLSPELDTTCFEWNNHFFTAMRNARKASVGEAPWLVMLLGSRKVLSGNEMVINQYLCTGVLIADKWVLTSAHCLGDHDFHLQIYIGNKLPKNWHKEDTDYYSITRFGHPKYNNSDKATQAFDIGLIQMNKGIKHRPIPLLSDPNSICLPPERGHTIEYTMNEYAMTAGWGGMAPNESAYDEQHLTIGYVKIDHPDQNARDIVGGPHILSRKGDSGGPVWQYYLGRAVMIGVLSLTIIDNTTNCQPDVYKQSADIPTMTVWVPFHMSWIKNITRLK